MNWDAKISINTQSEKFHYRNHQSCLLQLLSFLDARRTRGILLLMDTVSPKTAPEMATPTTSVPCSLQAEPLESPSTHWPSPWVQRPGVPRQKVLQNPWSLSLPSWRPDQLCLETDLPSHPCWHELLRRLLRADLDWNFSPKPSLQPLQMEPLRGYSAPTPQILQHRWGLAPRISLPDGLLQSYNLEISRLLEEGKNLTDVKMTQHLMRQPPPPRARKWIIYDEKLKRIVDDFESYDLVDYLTAIGNVI